MTEKRQLSAPDRSAIDRDRLRDGPDRAQMAGNTGAVRLTDRFSLLRRRGPGVVEHSVEGTTIEQTSGDKYGPDSPHVADLQERIRVERHEIGAMPAPRSLPSGRCRNSVRD